MLPFPSCVLLVILGCLVVSAVCIPLNFRKQVILWKTKEQSRNGVKMFLFQGYPCPTLQELQDC
jgi:hypothetical protein